MTATVTSTPVAQLSGVSKTYGEGATAVHALRDADLEIAPGELVVILGPSGSGKTTLLNLIGGIERASIGRVVIADNELGSLDTEELTEIRRHHIGFVFQFFNLIPTLTARENVALIAELVDRHGADDRVEQALSDVGLADRANHFPAQLSGGEQQRVALARALVKQPDVLLCDEPTGALDVETGRTVLALLERQARSGGRAVVVVTHNAAIGKLADRVVRLRDGAIVSDEPNEHPMALDEVDW